MLQGRHVHGGSLQTYEIIKNNSMSVFVFIALDLIVSVFGIRARSSATAHAVYKKLWRSLQELAEKVYDPDHGGQRGVDFSECEKLIAQASEYGEQANIEVRMWRTEWKRALFKSAIDTVNHIVATLKVVDASPGEKNTGASSLLMPTLEPLPIEIRAEIISVIQEKMRNIEPLLDIFIHEDARPFERVRLLRRKSKERRNSLPEKLMQSWLRHYPGSSQFTSVEEDVTANMSRVLMAPTFCFRS